MLLKTQAETTIKGFKELGVDINQRYAAGAKVGKTKFDVFLEEFQKATKGDLQVAQTIMADQQAGNAANALANQIQRLNNMALSIERMSTGRRRRTISIKLLTL